MGVVDTSPHFQKLERMYLSAPMHEYFKDVSISVGEKQAEISLPITKSFYHAAGAMHGSIYFKLLDDAAFFAVQSTVEDVFVLTTSFHIQLFRPVSKGVVTAKGMLSFEAKRWVVADAVLHDEKQRVIAKGSGNFMRSNQRLEPSIGYQ